MFFFYLCISYVLMMSNMKKPLKKIYLILISFICSVCLRVSADNHLFKEINAAHGLADNSAQTILSLPDGRMAISTIGNINFYDGVTFKSINASDQNRYRLSNYRGNYHLYCDREERLWLKHRYEVACIDMKKEDVVSNLDSVFKVAGRTKEIEDIFVCSKGILWIVTEGQLTHKGSSYRIKLSPTLNLQDVDQCNGQLLLFYDNGEVASYDLKTGKALYTLSSYSKEDENKFNSSSVLCPYLNGFFQIRNGKNQAILQYFDVEKKTWTELMRVDYSLNNMAIRNNMLYIASAYGYWTYDCSTKTFEHTQELKLLSGKQLLTDINTICFDHQGGIWIGTEKRGLMYSKPITSPFISYPWTDPKAIEYAKEMDRRNITSPSGMKRGVNCIYEDSRGWKWVGTQTGLQLFKNPNASRPDKTFQYKDGLTNEVIHSIIEDDMNNIWISTSYGIACLVIRNKHVKYISCYNDRDNVPAEMFDNGRVMKTADGTIVMIAIDHVVAFNPKNFTMLESTSMLLRPKMTRLMINGSFISNEMQSNGIVIDNISSHRDHLELDDDMNSINLTFSSFNYFRPQQTYYRVRVTGAKSAWNDWKVLSISNSRGLVDRSGVLHLPLLALPPGDYKVEVQASMFPYEWNFSPTIVTITINEPWWKTTGLQVFLIVLIMLLGFLNIVAYNRNFRRETIRNTKEVEVLKRIKSYIDRTLSMKHDSLRPTFDNNVEEDLAKDASLDEAFIKMMLAIIPIITLNNKDISIKKLARKAGVKEEEFFTLLSKNINKNPRSLAYAIMLDRSQALLTESTMGITEIALACGFDSPNYFISGFYHRFRITPLAYRQKYGINQ